MTVFKTFLKILNKNKFVIIMYTVILLIFGVFNIKTQEQSVNFQATKPDVMIINKDGENKITKDFIKYMKENTNIIKIENEEDKINDALFYREVNYVIYIPEGFNDALENGKNFDIQVKSSGDYNASLAEMITERYMKVAKIYQSSGLEEEKIISNINETLYRNVQTKITSKLDTNSLSKATYYFNFESYSLLACLIYVICLILSTFNSKKIKMRTTISSTDYKKNNRILLLSNYLYSFIVWIFYMILSILFVGNIIFTFHGLIYALNSLVFTICATTLAFLIASIVQNKNAINGIVNVVALGSSFLCGVFVPMTWLPDSVLKIAHILPTYYYVKTNDILQTLETLNIKTLKPIIINMAIILLFAIMFIVLTNIITRKKRVIN